MSSLFFHLRTKWVCAGLAILLGQTATAEVQFFEGKSINYRGLIYLDGQPANPGIVGMGELKLGRHGGFSARYNTGYGKMVLKGDFDNEGLESKKISGDQGIGQVDMVLDPDTLIITGTMDFNENNYPGREGFNLVFVLQPEVKGSNLEPVPGAGRHEMILIEGVEDGAQSEVRIDIKTKGKVKMKGLMPDGRKVKCASAFCEDGRIPVYVVWKNPHTVMLGWITVDEFGHPTLSGEFEWNSRLFLDESTLQTLVTSSVILDYPAP